MVAGAGVLGRGRRVVVAPLFSMSCGSECVELGAEMGGLCGGERSAVGIKLKGWFSQGRRGVSVGK